MARPKRIEYEDVTFFLFKGQTLERFLDLLPEWRNDELLALVRVELPGRPELVLMSWGALMDRRIGKPRSHHKFRPPNPQKPKFGKGGGRASGGRGAAHVVHHLKWFPGTTVHNCPACQGRGVAAICRRMSAERAEKKENDNLLIFDEPLCGPSMKPAYYRAANCLPLRRPSTKFTDTTDVEL